MKKYSIIALFIGLALFFSTSVFAQTTGLTDDPDTVNIYLFWGDGCPHCAKEKAFLDKYQAEHSEIDIYSFEIWKNAENRSLIQQVGKTLDLEIKGVPLTIIGNQYIPGYGTDETTGKAIADAVAACVANPCPDPIGQILGFSTGGSEGAVPGEETPTKETPQENQNEGEKAVNNIPVPFFGNINPQAVSLPLLTVVIGLLDGFNPCAMWTLMFLISLLIGMENKRRMWVLGSTFIVTSAGVYFLFMSAWLNLLLFIGFIVWVRYAIGAVALGSGVYGIRDFFTNKNATCKVTHGGQRKKVFDRLRDIVKRKSFLLALGGIILLAFAVNLVELICSAGLPAIYTQVLTLSEIPTWQYYLYILGYVFFFMVDDLFVFFVSMATLQMTGITTKYSRWSRLIGGVLVFILGLLLIFKPEWLMFG